MKAFNPFNRPEPVKRTPVAQWYEFRFMEFIFNPKVISL